MKRRTRTGLFAKWGPTRARMSAVLLAAPLGLWGCGGRTSSESDDKDPTTITTTSSESTTQTEGDESGDGDGFTPGTDITYHSPPSFSSIAAGQERYCGITQLEGHLVCVKDGQIQEQVEGPFIALEMDEDTATWQYRCAIREGGALECWGMGDIPTPEYEFVDLSLGMFSACARRSTGELDCWLPDSFSLLPPMAVAGHSYSVNADSFCTDNGVLEKSCVDRDGNHYLPDGDAGHFENGLYTNVRAAPGAGCASILIALENEPDEEWGDILAKDNIACFSEAGASSKVNGLFEFFEINANQDGCAVNSDGRQVVCWGAFDGTVPSDLGDQVTQLAISTTIACALRSDGTVRCWEPKE